MDHAEWIEGFSDKNSGRTNYTRTDMKISNTFQLDMNSELGSIPDRSESIR